MAITVNAEYEHLRSHTANGARAVGRLLLLGAAFGAASCSGGGGGSPLTGQPPVIRSFAVSSSWITTGDSATLQWSVTDAARLSIDPIGTVSGTSAKVMPAADTTYVLTASNQFGSTQAQATLAVFPPPTTWFAPLGATSVIPVQGATDYFDLFSPTASWSTAASHVTVFKMYSAMLTLDDATLRNVFSDLKRRHIAFAIEWGPLDEPNRCGIGEGFDGTLALQYAQRIRDLGGSLQYIAFDEPVDGAVLYEGPQACHWTPLQTAQNAAKNVALVQSVFPDIVIGDIEVVPNDTVIDTWLGAYEQWVDAWQAVTGKPLAFFHFDVNWGHPAWQPAAAALTRALEKRGIPVGHIYNGFGPQSDAAWIQSAAGHLTDMEAHESLVPDEAIFQSWEPYPKHLLPESDPAAFTYLIDQYFRKRTTLTLTSGSTAGQGALSSASGPLANTQVQLTAVPLSGTGQAGVYTYSDSLPTGTQYVVFGARVATENCSGVALPAEFYLTSFTLDAGAAGQVHADFTNQLTGWGIWGNASIAQVEQNTLHIQVTPGETMGLNSVSLPFAAAGAGAAYTLTVNAMIPIGATGDGCAIAVFQNASFNELSRAVIQIVPLPLSLGSLQTDASGVFAVNLAPQAAPYELWADYAGSSAMWPAAAAVGIGTPSPPAITTSALPDATAGTAYTQQLGVSGGHAPYLWASGTPPPGLVLRQDGTLTGTPTTAGTYTLSVSAVDNSTPPQATDASVQLVVR